MKRIAPKDYYWLTFVKRSILIGPIRLIVFFKNRCLERLHVKKALKIFHSTLESNPRRWRGETSDWLRSCAPVFCFCFPKKNEPTYFSVVSGTPVSESALGSTGSTYNNNSSSSYLSRPSHTGKNKEAPTLLVQASVEESSSASEWFERIWMIHFKNDSWDHLTNSLGTSLFRSVELNNKFFF